MNEMKLNKLKEPFSLDDIEWRVQKSGIGKQSKKPYALVLAYVDNRAIQERLDEVCGPENWANQFEKAPSGEGVLCGIGIKIDGEWVWKWDGSENTQFEPIKGGLSSAMKRAAVHWGIGRYLYRLEAGFAEFSENGRYKDKIEEQWYRWNPPQLPEWAIPNHKSTPEPVKKTLDESANAGWDGTARQGK